MALVHTTHGLVERERLRVEDVTTEEESGRKTLTQWFMGEELVRQDVYLNLYHGLTMGQEQGNIGG